MAENIVELLTDVADAIREKKGSTEPIKAQNFANEIKSLPSDGEVAVFAETMQTNGNGIMQIQTIIVNEGVTELAFNAFANMPILRIEIPNSVIKLGDSCFYNCSKMEAIDLPQSIINLGSVTFRACTSLKYFIVPPLVSILYNALFLGASKLSALIIQSNNMILLAQVNALQGTEIEKGTGYIYVPDDLVESYKGATNWSTYASQIKGLSELPNEL